MVSHSVFSQFLATGSPDNTVRVFNDKTQLKAVRVESVCLEL